MLTAKSNPVWGPTIEQFGDTGQVSAPCVMKSGGGYYIGTAFKHVEGDCAGQIVPNERLSSGYFASFEEAETHLDYYKEA